MARKVSRGSRKRPAGAAGASRKPGRSGKARPAPGGNGRGRAQSRKKPARPQARPKAASPARPKLTAKRARVLLNLEQAMARRIVGKDDAVAKIARVVRVRMAQLDFRPDRPNGSFLLVGPTGVGKNELAYALAESLYGSEEPVACVDLAEVNEEGSVARLGVTLVPGAPNQAMEGLLTSPVRRNPEAIVLLKGLEQAHPSFHPLLQQILEQGRMDDVMGPVSFSQSVIFVTTHPRRDESTAVEIGFSRSALAPQEATRKRLERTFSPDLLDAFNEIIDLPPLTPEDVRRIARYKVEAVLQRLHHRHQEIAVDENVFETVIPAEQARQDGASSLNRTLEDRLFNPLARYLLEHRRTKSIRVEMEGETLKIRQ